MVTTMGTQHDGDAAVGMDIHAGWWETGGGTETLGMAAGGFLRDSESSAGCGSGGRHLL